MTEMKALDNVYSYYFPEVRQVIDEVTRKFPHDVFLNALRPGGLDNFHVPIIEKYVRYSTNTLPGLEKFNHRYVTAGSSEGIFHTLVFLRKKNPNTVIYTMKGEYSGYRKFAEYLGLKVVDVDLEKEYPNNLEKGVWFITNPSTLNGNIVPNDLIRKICDADHKVVIDCSYVGLTRPHCFEIDHPNIITVLVSFSKSFGLFYHRIGFTFSKEDIPSLETNKWFKNILSLIIIDRIISKFDQDYFYDKYRPIQCRIIDKINAEFDLKLRPSDVILVANTNQCGLEKYKREGCYRFCLTPYFMEEESLND